MNDTEILYRGQVGSRLYGCQREDSDNDYFVIATPNYIQKNNQRKHYSFDTDEFIYGPDYLYTRIFDIKDNPVPIMSTDLCEQLFSISDENIITPFSQWMVENRQLILDSNRPKFQNILLMRAKSLLRGGAKHTYISSPKTLFKPIMHLQTYINYAEKPEEGFFKAQHLNSEQQEMIKLSQQGVLPPIEIYHYLLELKTKSQNYAEFWNTDPDKEIINSLSNEMTILIEEAIN